MGEVGRKGKVFFRSWTYVTRKNPIFLLGQINNSELMYLFNLLNTL